MRKIYKAKAKLTLSPALDPMASKRKQRLQLDSILVLHLASNQNMTVLTVLGRGETQKKNYKTNNRERAKIEANQAWDYAHSTRLVRRFYFPCLVRPIYFFHLLRSLFPGYPSLPYLDGIAMPLHVTCTWISGIARSRLFLSSESTKDLRDFR